ncbi:Anaerobic nitric oxide reductase transcription regulator NorR [bioreactor metagenome]|uniref:Anaerobic nitric oxide reductase transcription regulator NorR n=1 Tax=bioreactor metagenome TaxID=1076179 RepID=A0A644YJZ6_9ZZZZ
MKRGPVHLSVQQDFGFLSGYADRMDRLLAILESSFDGIYIADGEANTIWCNRSYEVISGLDRREVIGRNMRDMVSAGTVSRSGTLTALERRAAITIDQTFKTGRQAIITSTPIFDNADNIVMVVTNVRDMSEIYDLKEELARSRELTMRYRTEIELSRRMQMDSGGLVVTDRNMLELLRVVSRVARLDTIVLLLGETGVGKERVANYIHASSPRRSGSFLKVNCGAIAESIAESELFGYEKGAFTGASREGKPGLFEVADKGTIFLDEVGELPLSLQTKLLRVIQEQELVRVGGSKAVKVDVRILAATNRDLKALVDKGVFREDLYYRLNVFPVVIPPLRERKNDIPRLAESFIRDLNRKYRDHKTLSQSALGRLMAYSWPGNVRELKNVLERAFIMSEGDEVGMGDLGMPVLAHPDQTPITGEFSLKQHMEQIEARYISLACRQSESLRAAAHSIGMDPATFLRKRKKYERMYPDIRSDKLEV